MVFTCFWYSAQCMLGRRGQFEGVVEWLPVLPLWFLQIAYCPLTCEMLLRLGKWYVVQWLLRHLCSSSCMLKDRISVFTVLFCCHFHVFFCTDFFVHLHQTFYYFGHVVNLPPVSWLAGLCSAFVVNRDEIEVWSWQVWRSRVCLSSDMPTVYWLVSLFAF